MSDWMDGPTSRPREIIPGLLRKGDMMVLAAPPKAGKTLAAIDLAVLLAGRGTERPDDISWLGYPVPFDDDPEPDFRLGDRVLYLNLENPADECRARFLSSLAAHGLPLNEDIRNSLHVLNLKDQEASWDLDALWDVVYKYMTSRKMDDVEVIIVDSIYTLIDGDENSNRAMAQFFGELREICCAFDGSMIALHHFNKSWGSIKGHADRIAGAGTISRIPEVIATLTPTKSRDGSVELNVTTRRHDGQDQTGRHYRADGPRFVECAQDAATVQGYDRLAEVTIAAFDELASGGPVRVQDLAAKLGKHRATITERVKKYGFTINKGIVSRVVGG